MKRMRGFTLVELLIVICVICILIALITPNFMRARSMAQFTSCESNLKNLATAAELYSTENQSRYPTAIAKLVPQYIVSLPICPSCMQGYSYSFTTVPDAYTLWCGTAQAHAMAGKPDGFPQYYSSHGGADQ
jgi:prepilin-type N-terminal cleavage/methylation domain-containing protein